jgi:site-specific recombinase XerD
MKKPRSPNALARVVQAFFRDYLPELRGVSSNTVLSYRDTLVLLLRFVSKSQNKDVVSLELENITPEAVLDFLNYLEKERHNKVSSRNVRLAAIHAFFRYVAVHAPEHIELAQRILGVPFKRTGTRPIDYLEYDEISAVLSSVDRSASDGRRDYALLALMFNTGARVQEVVDLNVSDLQLEHPFQVKLYGKGQKTRICPLWPQTGQVLKEFLLQAGLTKQPNGAVFRNCRGERLTRFGVRYILAKYWRKAAETRPTLSQKRLHPHSMRHSCSMHLLKSGVDLASISHWLGHASINTTNRYAMADLEMKRQTIAQARDPEEPPPSSWSRDASILEWLETL